jgi:Suppressor of fused protein (SUFU)
MAEELSPHGDPIFVHEEREREPEPTEGDQDLVDAIHEHLERVFADHWTVFHESDSDRVHIDVHVIPPGTGRDWITLVTSGMAERPMTVPEGLEDYRYAELVLALPPDWPILAFDSSFEDTRTFWPLYLLKDLARLPHFNDTFLGYAHSVENGDPPQRFEGTEFCGSLVAGPRLTPEEFDELTLPDGRTIHFYAVYPLHQDEMDFKLEHGCDALLDRFVEAGVTELVDASRPSVVA